jgi:sugar lactone lactonase YvrE
MIQKMKRITFFTSVILLMQGVLFVTSCNKPTVVTNSRQVSLTAAKKAPVPAVNMIGTLQVITLAGNGTFSYVEGTTTAATFRSPAAVAADAAGNLYIADMLNHVIRKWTPRGVVNTLAGNGTAGYAEGVGSAAQFNSPSGVAVDATGNVYVADKGNHVIRKISPAGNVSTLAGTPGTPGSTDGPGTAAQFNLPSGVALDASGNILVADAGNNKIRKITPAGFVSLVAGTGSSGSGDGPGAFAQFNAPSGVGIDAGGNIYVADAGNNKIRKIAGALVNTLAGGGTSGTTPGFVDASGTSALFNSPTGIVVDAAGTVYATDKSNHAIRQITPSGVVSTLSGNGTALFTDGLPAVARFSSPAGLSIDASGTLFIADQGNNRIRELGVIPTVTTLAGNTGYGFVDATGTDARFHAPFGIAVDAAGTVYVGDEYNYRIRKISSAGAVTTLAGNGISGFVNGQGASAEFVNPEGVALDAAGNIYVADNPAHAIRKVTPAGVVTTLAGNGIPGYADGTGAAAQFNRPVALAVDASGNVYVADNMNNRIRKITPAGVVSTLAGDGVAGYREGIGVAAEFNNPSGIAVDAAGNVYVSDRYNQAIRKITPDGNVSTFAGGNPIAGGADGTGIAVQFNYPWGVAVDASGNVYVGDTFNQRIRKITPAGTVTTIAGNTTGGDLPFGGFADGPAPFARFNAPIALAVDAAGAIYVSDYSNHRIRKIQ